ncbi:MAG: DUF2851 family protein [Saprospiraceae bacterium]|nr:DUF2851 family protein [Saprospiraceae bacterium]
MLVPVIREDLLYYVWKTKSFDLSNLKTTDNRKIEIVQFGSQNYDSGPDFSNGKVKIEDTLWIGNVEMHVYSSDWEKHCHDLDKAYDTVILHVVYEHDKEVYTTSEQYIPCIELKNRINQNVILNYSQLIANNNWIPCERLLLHVPKHIISFWLQRLIAERLEVKTKRLKSILESTNTNWEETAYIFLFRYMGAKVNMEPFESLARALPYRLIQSNRNDIFKLEALLFGQSGMLEANYDDEYFLLLKKEYQFLRKKYNLVPISVISWKFSKMRPVGFPTIRIAQLAQILFQTDRIFSQMTYNDDINAIREVFNVKPSHYWESHYRFGKESQAVEKKVGKGFIDQLIINVVCPVIFAYGKYLSDESYCQKAIDLLETIKSEQNAIVRGYKKLGIKCKTASESQALVRLKNVYCDQKRCATCAIGNAIIKL